MAFKLNHIVGLLGLSFMLHGFSAFAEQPSVEEVFTLLGMDNLQVAELLQGQPVTYALSEKSEDELGVAVIQYLPLPLAKVLEHLRIDDIGLLEVNVTAHGLLTTDSKVDSLKTVSLSNEDALTLLNAEPGDDFNLSAQELDSLKSFKKSLKYNPHTSISGAVGQHYREILFQRFQAYRQGGTYAIAPYMREDDLESKVSVELHQAAKASFILERYFPDFFKVWLDYPKILPTGAKEIFPWVEKNVEGRLTTILRHRIDIDWSGGALILIREFYASHSYNSSQWITGCFAYREGTVVFQQVRSYTDQVAGVASDVKHLVGRELLKDKMLKYFERLCSVLDHCS
jgi:hypothetical protein